MREGWEYKKLGEVCQVSAGQGAPQGEDNYSDVGTPFVKAGNLVELINGKQESDIQKVSDEVAKAHRLVLYKTGSVVFAKSGMSCMKGHVYTLKNDCYVVSHLAILQPQNISSAYLNYYLQYHKPNNLIKDEGYPSISLKDIENSIISIPSNIERENRVVSELDKINELIRLKKEQLKDYDNLSQSIFYEMFGDPVVNEKGWEVKKFSEVASFKNGLNFGKNENGYSYKILGVGDFKNNYVVNSSLLEYINLNDELSSDYFLKPEDLVFVRSNGSKELVGRCVSVDCTEPTTYSGFCIRCRLDENSGVLPMYLLYICKNKGIREYLTQSGRGCNISNVNQKILNSTDIIIPPLSKQELFIQRIELIEKQKAEIQSTIADLETLLASRMQYWFD
ncbi:MAG: restriction endonuclease subunit S [Prevotella sp.]|nr:restriction endonuclease subunit S [Prevotella sp.]